MTVSVSCSAFIKLIWNGCFRENIAKIFLLYYGSELEILAPALSHLDLTYIKWNKNIYNKHQIPRQHEISA